MNFLAKHSTQLNGEVICPGDKSISQRIVMIASYLNADINITGFLNGNDPLSTANALNQIGAGIKINGTNVSIAKREGALASSSSAIDLGNSGTGIRLLMGFTSGLGIKATLTGDESLGAVRGHEMAQPELLFAAQAVPSRGLALHQATPRFEPSSGGLSRPTEPSSGG